MNVNKFLELIKSNDSEAEKSLKKLKEFEEKEKEMKQKLTELMSKAQYCSTPYEFMRLADEWEKYSIETKEVSKELADFRYNFDIDRAEKSYELAHELIQELKEIALLQMMQ